MINKTAPNNSDEPGAVYVQYGGSQKGVPAVISFKKWVSAALGAVGARGEVLIRVVEWEEGQQLNAQYRNKSDATNVLSFPMQVPECVAESMQSDHLGDIVICAPVIAREAQQQGKPSQAHWAHMVVHGVLHLLGYDHQSEEQAAHMEAQEVTILKQLGFNNPYGEPVQ